MLGPISPLCGARLVTRPVRPVRRFDSVGRLMTRAEVHEAIRATVLDEAVLGFLKRISRFPMADRRAHGALVAPQVIAFWHPCGHTSWVDYNVPGPKGGMSVEGR